MRHSPEISQRTKAWEAAVIPFHHTRRRAVGKLRRGGGQRVGAEKRERGRNTVARFAGHRLVALRQIVSLRVVCVFGLRLRHHCLFG